MIYVLIGVIALGLWIYYLIDECFDLVEGVMIGFLTLIVTALFAGLLCTGSLGLATLFANSSYVKTNQAEIVALQDNSSTTGRFFLGSGSINGSMQYTYITKDYDEMKMKTIGIRDASLIYASTPKVEEYQKFFDSKIVKFLFGKQPFHSPMYKVYIPEGTVKENYNVDLQ